MAEDLIRYDVLAQEALRGLVKKVITEVAQTGLPGDHHFFITFDTRHPGARLSTRLRDDYPTEMTIVLQHQFWDLAVTDSAFEIGLSFKGVPEKLHVPFHALRSFVDPHAKFALKFDVSAESPAVETERTEAADADVGAASTPTAEAGGSAQVVSLDTFRKKNG